MASNHKEISVNNIDTKTYEANYIEIFGERVKCEECGSWYNSKKGCECEELESGRT